MSLSSSKIQAGLSKLNLTGKLKIGVLSLQGDYQKHFDILSMVDNVDPFFVRLPRDLEECDGLIIPGGESTTVGKLMDRYGLDIAIKKKCNQGMTLYGTCTGMILMAKEIEGSSQHRLSLLDISVKRNAFGRQIDSFETDIKIPEISSDYIRAVFIRAPIVTQVGDRVEVLARLDNGGIIMVRQDNLVASAFHPELTDNTSIHKWFCNLTAQYKSNQLDIVKQ
ncbi:MAG: pyridoxal 5'-phosphate synthase glutaminase subunit PdxT [Armatimonadota bacterium]